MERISRILVILKVTSLLCVLTAGVLMAGCSTTSHGNEAIMSRLIVAPSEKTMPAKEEIFLTYSHPETGFTIKYPQTWSIIQTKYEETNDVVTFSSPDIRASLQVELDPHHLPKFSRNWTQIEFFNKTQVAGHNGSKFSFIVKNPDREYNKKFLVIQCPTVTYTFDYEYEVGDSQMEKTLQAMLDSVNITCPLNESSVREMMKGKTYSRPDLGFVIEYPQILNISQTTEGKFETVTFSSPDNQASFWVSVYPWHLWHHGGSPFIGDDLGFLCPALRYVSGTGSGPGSSLPSYDNPMSFNKIRLRNPDFDDIRRLMAGQSFDPRYRGKFISIPHYCQLSQKNEMYERNYYIYFEYPADNELYKSAVLPMVNSIKFTCPSVN